MGIRGLWSMVTGQSISYEDTEGKTLCVDGNYILFSCMYSSNPRFITEYTLRCIGNILNLGVDPIMVFDGTRPMFKRREKKRPQKYMQEAEEDQEQDMETHKKQVYLYEKIDWPNPFPDEEIFVKKQEICDQMEEEMEEEDYSLLQMQRITERHKRIISVIKKRVHGASSLQYKLKEKRAQIVEKKRKERKKEYGETIDHLEKIKRLVYPKENIGEDIHGSRSEDLTINHLHPEAPVIEVPVSFEKSEYDLLQERYSFPKQDELLVGESVSKHTLSVGYSLVTEILDILCISYIIAPAESDAVYHAIERALHTDGVITGDSDIFLFSTQPIYRDLFKRSKKPYIYRTEEHPLEYTWSELVLLSWMFGSDYTPGIKGIGPSKAQAIIQKYREEKEAQNNEAYPWETHKDINEEALKTAFHSVVNEVLTDEEIQRVYRVKRIYQETEYQVKIENLEKKQISIVQLQKLMDRRTTWTEPEKNALISVIKKENLRRSENAN
ncbi:hypothetical protein NEFER03_0669 [Nematocida sp. LUAm3]|nr:hypothetical protein NEFER03_0669 [Nematocida sp. LUAm3]KAI5175128.1 hypothetical protein NEFER02_1089 [Nematocida sp. LUAm2]KAI5178200.1 hypothetical protein NEFER01_1378 [Nematocida sp. LUAm1]